MVKWVRRAKKRWPTREFKEKKSANLKRGRGTPVRKRLCWKNEKKTRPDAEDLVKEGKI